MATESFIEVNLMLLWALGNGLKSKVFLIVFDHFEFIEVLFFFLCFSLLFQPKQIDMITRKMVNHEEREREREQKVVHMLFLQINLLTVSG